MKGVERKLDLANLSRAAAGCENLAQECGDDNALDLRRNPASKDDKPR
jgi:hypothetical protein